MKNMKLTNLSLSVLIALGLVACGGSDNKDNAPLDKDQHGEAGGNGGNGGKPEVTPEHTGTLPQRYSPSLNVPDDLKGQVAARKRFVVRRGFADPALGYAKDAAVYEKALNTDPADIKRTSVYNYVKEKDLVAVSADGLKATGGFDPKAKGAISIGVTDKIDFNNGDKNKINAWVEGAGGKYYRVYPDSTFADYNSKTTFKVAKTGVTEADLDGKDPEKIAQSDVVFIANADFDNHKELKLGEAGKFILGQPTKQKEVVLNELSAFGGVYGVRALSQNLDLSQFPKDATKIQEEKIVGKYQVINTKGTADNGDDTVLDREVVLGNARVYNLPYSIALVTTNAKMDDKKDIFNLDGTGAFQLNGFQTISVPKDGRAIYKGKSFSATTEGDVDLFADFFENEAGISGRIHNRKDKVTKEDLAELTLERITLTTPQIHRTSSYDTDVNVKGDSSYANNWTVQLYGADAQEAGGFLRVVDAPNKTVKDIKEVYTSQRQILGNKSNDNTTK